MMNTSATEKRIVLNAFRVHGDMTVAQVAKATGLSKATCVATLNELNLTENAFKVEGKWTTKDGSASTISASY